ncbi:hypothetical protein [Aeromonas salmonicida]|uniref:hypothetical protein n=1 Tax=Aeromonas salmonicida TaxID=645 RepID=UPI0013A6A1CE|nr:hypothetical protein [Aeromonas salmonicida]
MLKIAENEAPPFMRGNIINFMSETTAEISIEYADYVIARGFIEAFDEWMKGCDKEQKNSTLKFARKWSHLCSGFFQFIIALLIIYYAYTSIPNYFSSNLHPETIARFIVTYIGALVLMVPIAGATGDIVERAIDTYPILSYLKLNKGDERLISEFSGSRIGTTIAFLFGIIMAIVIGIISSKLEKLI